MDPRTSSISITWQLDRNTPRQGPALQGFWHLLKFESHWSWMSSSCFYYGICSSINYRGWLLQFSGLTAHQTYPGNLGPSPFIKSVSRLEACELSHPMWTDCCWWFRIITRTIFSNWQVRVNCFTTLWPFLLLFQSISSLWHNKWVITFTVINTLSFISTSSVFIFSTKESCLLPFHSKYFF